jgi:hypothetical protein
MGVEKMEKMFLVFLFGCLVANGQEKVGAIYKSSEGLICLSILNSALKPNDTVDYLGENSRRLLGSVAVGKAINKCDEQKDEERFTRYQLELKKEIFDNEIELVGLVRPFLKGVRDSTEIMLSGYKQKFEMYQCASSEGIHLFLREKRNHSKIQWHRYISLPFELEGNCMESDFKGIKEG